MDATHVHLLLNHFPILGALFGFILLAYGLIRNNKSLENAGLITLIVITLLTIPVFLSGEEAEETVENLAGVSEYFIEEHEELAEIALWMMVATGISALLSLVISTVRNKRAAIIKTITVLLAAGTFGVMVAVGNHGGKIRHSELRDQNKQQLDQPAKEEGREYEEDDD